MAKKLYDFISYPLDRFLNTWEFKNALQKALCCTNSGGTTSIEAGDNITITGTGTEDDPYIISTDGGIDTTAWHRLGDAATSGDFLGTTNNQPLIFKTNNIESARILSNQKFLLGTTTDSGNYRLFSEGGSMVGLAGQSESTYAGYFASGNTSLQPTLYVTRNNTTANIAEFYGPIESVKFTALGSIIATALSGVGTRMVVADSTGLLSTQAIPAGISGVTTNRITKASSATTLTNSLLFDNGTSVLLGTTSAIASALFAMNSTTQGFLLPRMSTTQKNAISSPATGLQVFDTTVSTPSYYDGTIWRNSLIGYTEGSLTGNTALGDSSGTVVLGGFNNTFAGYQSGQLVTGGSDNTAVGSQAGRSITTSGSNSLFGAGSGRFITGQNNTAVGARSLYNTTTGQSNSAFGYQSLNTNVDGQYNSAFGTLALFSNTSGRYSVAVGDQAAYSNTTGWYNTAIGSQSLYNATGAAQYNTSIGYQSGMNLTTGSNCIAIGLNTNFLSATTDNQMNIGNIIFGNGLTGSVGSPAGNIGIGDNNPTTRLSITGTTKTTNFYTTSTTPTGTLGAGAGSGSPSITFATGSTNQSGKITIVTGTTPSASATFFTLVFSGSFTAPNGSVMILTPINDNACNIIGNGVSSLKTDSTATNNVVATTGTIAPTAATTYIFAYQNSHY